MTGESVFSFRLYVAGEGLNSARAIANLNALCQDRLAGRHQIEKSPRAVSSTERWVG